ncbi:uncharacterized protein EI90DRAFT_3014987 [Cantharellus anzutake]|uniref:uncharacterized protein n=1 Tax=Cantharellus anzutake TaxID=1750568 RepID=UPI001905CC42|nr:uncharacterized protein EI90DRAFT_3014987 [Cantharellus anzutake]KAF8334746.1 hypothetical protein EI90DRAFT_3014987 [Cantharellus anzutake]
MALHTHFLQPTMGPKRPAALDPELAPVSKRSSHLSKLNTGNQAEPPTKPPATRCVQWLENPHWTDRLVSYLLENPNVRLKLSGDSIQTAKAEGRLKISNGEKKKDYWAAIAKDIWDREEEAECEFYVAALNQYTTAIQGRIS